MSECVVRAVKIFDFWHGLHVIHQLVFELE